MFQVWVGGSCDTMATSGPELSDLSLLLKTLDGNFQLVIDNIKSESHAVVISTAECQYNAVIYIKILSRS